MSPERLILFQKSVNSFGAVQIYIAKFSQNGCLFIFEGNTACHVPEKGKNTIF